MSDNSTVGDDNEDYGSDDAILARARREYRLCFDSGSNNRLDALDDLKFLKGGENQWDSRALTQRKADGRPVITVNSLPTYLHQVTNDQRQNRPSIKVHPVDDNADPETAKIMQGLIRHIEYDSNADVAYDRAVNSAAAIGFGYWRLVTEYESDSGFTQKIMFKSIRNALCVKIDPLCAEPDGSDMNYAFVEFLMSRPDFKRDHPDAEANDIGLFQNSPGTYTNWLSDETVLVCDYYCIEKTTETAVLLSNGESGFKKDLLSMPPGVTIVKEREAERRKVMLYKITGSDVLDRTEIKCKWIPVFPVYGDEIDIEGKVSRAGIVRNAKGPAQSYNVMMSGATEEIALRSKSPYIGAEGFMEGHEDDWAQANNRAFPALEYNPTTVDGHLAPPPQRQPMADIPSGMLAMAMHAGDNVKMTAGVFTGTFQGRLGARGTATSGVQEQRQQAEGNMANFHYTDGLLRTIRHCGRCLIPMIQAYYDTERVVRVLGEDDTADHATINQPNLQRQPSEDGRIRAVLNDVTAGTFDITISAGPSYSTLRQEAAEGMAENMAKNPPLWGVIGDLYVKNQDWPGADAMAARIKKTIPPQLLEDENKDQPQEVIQTPQGPLPIAQVPQLLEQLQQQLQMAQEAIQKAQVDKQQAEVMKQNNEQTALQIDRDRVAIERDQMERDKANDSIKFAAEAAKAEAETEKYRAEQMRAEADAIRAAEDARQKEFDAANKEPEVSLEDVEQLIIKSRPKSMTITAPSGGKYDVTLQ